MSQVLYKHIFIASLKQLNKNDYFIFIFYSIVMLFKAHRLILENANKSGKTGMALIIFTSILTQYYH